MIHLRLPPGLPTALRTLSILPVPDDAVFEPRRALRWFPATGAGLGLAAAAAAWLARYRLAADWPGLAGLLAVLLYVWLTRGLHLDGLADTADGFGGGRDRDRALAIMKDSRTGAFGAIALAVALLARWVAISRLAAIGGLGWLVAASTLARTAQVAIMARLPYARAGQGTAHPFVEAAAQMPLAGVTLIALAVAACCLPLWHALLALLAAAALTAGLARWFRARIGGTTGDTVGAASEIIEVTLLLLGGCLA